MTLKTFMELPWYICIPHLVNINIIQDNRGGVCPLIGIPSCFNLVTLFINISKKLVMDNCALLSL